MQKCIPRFLQINFLRGKVSSQKIVTLFLLTGLSLIFGFNSYAQNQKVKPEISSAQLTLVRVTPKLSDIDPNSMYGEPLQITRNMKGVIGREKQEEAEEKVEKGIRNSSTVQFTEGVQKPGEVFPNVPIPTLGVNQNGQSWSGFDPSDNNLAAGPNHVIQIMNNQSGSIFQIWDKTGAVVQTPKVLATVTGLSGAGDPIVIYDQLANRWMLAEFGPGACCNKLIIAVSTTADPTGSYSIYQYTDATFFPDYPKFSVWHNAYYATTNDFNAAGNTYLGSSVWAFDRAAMIAGAATATVVRFRQTGGGNPFYNMGTVCLEGTTPSTQNGLFIYPDGGSNLGIFELTPNFANPPASIVGAVSLLPITAYAQPPGSITQQGSATTIGTLGSRMMFRMNFRNRGGQETIVATHTVGATGGGQAAVRWYELRRIAGLWTVFQQGTLANPDGNTRWMGGISMDNNGTIGLMYDLAGPTSFPSVRFTGRNLTDPLNTMTLAEQTIVNGTVPHTIANRWGDYNTLVSDPSTVGDFWGTSQYGNNTTRIFKFSLTNGAAAPIITAGTSAITAESCAPANNVIDPNETVTVSFCLQNVGTLPTVNLVGTLLPTGGVTVPSAAQNYGIVIAGGPAVCRNFTFTANTACGATLIASIQLQDGATNLGTITYNFATGVVSTFFTQNFDAVAAPALPAGWAAANASGPAPLWVTSNASSVSAPNSIFVDDPAAVADKIIETPTIAVASAGASLSFRNNYTLESGFDGGVLEISINAAAYQDIITAGGVFTANGYTGTISSSFGNPLGGRMAWTGTAGSFLTSTVTLPPAAAGQNVKFRFRMGSDNSVAATGWRIDDVTISQRVCCTPLIPPTVTINQAAAQPDPTTVSPINFTAVFSEPVTGFTGSGVNLSGTAGATGKFVSGGPTTYNIQVSGMTASGTVIATIPANAATGTINVTGNVASTSTDNNVTYNLPPPSTGCITAASFTGPPVAIPDDVPAGVDIPITVSGVGTIADLNFRLDPGTGTCDATAGNTNASVDHTFNGDLIFKLTSPAATTVTLINQRGGSGNNFCLVTLDDDGGFPATSTMPGTGAISGNYAPENPLSAFDGQNANGVWTLNVSDNAGADLGSVRGFSLIFTSVAPTMIPRGNDTVCAGSTAGPYNFTSVPPGATFVWTNSNPAIGLGAGGTGNIPAFTATNATTAPITGTVTVTPQVPGSPIIATGSLLAGDATMPLRLFRGGISGTCGVTQAFPGTAGAGPYFYDTYTYTNTTGVTACVTVNLTTTDLVNANIQSAAYLGTFNPANLATNYIADPGLSTGTPATPAGLSYAFNLANGATTVIVVFSTNPNTGGGSTADNYRLSIGGLTVCAGSPTSFNIRVLPVGNVNPIPNQVVCRGLPTAPVNFTGTVPGTVFNWTNNNTSIGLAASGNGNIASFIAQNTTGIPQVATITVTPVYSPAGPPTPIVTNFNFTGAVQTFVVPAGITSVNIKSWGAQGNSNALSVTGGLGGYAEGNLAVTPGQTLFINTGGGATATISGGFNGGGAAGINSGCAQAQGGGGGGASDVRITANTLANRILVAGGGGGAGANRVANCGRGTGGGGGGGYYGGGGGAGWPGIPGQDGPVPTGGTQSAGGAGGVTTFSPGPTNGFPGALGMGGAGGTEVGSAQGGSATAERGGIGGGLVGGSGLYNNANNWCGQSGAGGSSYIGGVTSGVTTPGLRTGSGLVQISYTPILGVTCAGTPRTFTITVNNNQDIIIVADPGTTICEGDPTLLTVVTGTSTPVGTLYTQGTGTPANGSPSQVFEPANTAFNSQSADDFTVPAGAGWSITQITTRGINTGGGVPTSVNVFFYANSAGNLPGAAIASYNNVATFVRTGANYVVTLPTALNLTGGTYWMSFQVNMPFVGQGQWFWGNFGAANIGNQYAWQNPGGGFGTPCTSWGYGATGCNVGGGVNRNNHFSIIGTSVVGGGPLPPGYSFLWSPAAGLSSTTSNPVAASPMNTTLYTVNVTTGAGCTNQASILITVNKRPTVTTQPVSRTNCDGTAATFTVGGTGTGLAYQWQVNTTGCTAGPWNNLLNVAPYSGVNTATLNISAVTGLMNGYGYRVILTGACAPVNGANISNCALLTVNPLPVVAITPAGPVCGGVACVFGTQLSVGSTPPPVPGSVTVNSGVISVPIPDNNPVGASSNLTVAGIPANATITGARATWTMPHTWNGDMVFVLKSPNGSVLNLDYYLSTTGGAGATTGFVNTTVSSAGGPLLSSGTGTYTGTFRADANLAAAGGFGPPGPTAFLPTVSTWPPLFGPAIPNGTWTLAMYDGGPADVGTLTNWAITIDYTTPGTGGGPVLSYVWSPLAGLYTDAAACIPYTGTNTPTVYAAPTALTTYTVTATNVTTNCVSTSSVIVNYTPPAPTVTPSSVTMCLGDPAVRLISSSSTTSNLPQVCSGPISVIVPDNNPAGAISNLTVSGVPAGCNISAMSVTFNMTHTWDGDIVVALKAPNGQILNLDYYLSTTGGTGATTGFVNTKISSAGVAALSSGTGTYTGTFKADAVITNAFGGAGGPTGFTPTVTTWAPLYSTPNGVWTLAMKDGFGGDEGTLTSWCIDMTYICGVPATRATWSPIAGLFNDAVGTPYIGDARDTVWTRPTPAGVYPYQVTVQSVPAFLPNPVTFTNPANITINNVGPATPSPANLVVTGLPVSGVAVRSVNINGFSHTWAGDVNVVLQHPNGTTNVILMANSNADPLIAVNNINLTFSDAATLSIPATAPIVSGTYKPTNRNGATFAFLAPGPTVTGPTFPASPTLATFTGNMNGTWKLFVEDRVAGDAGTISRGYSIDFNVPVAPCTSPARTVIVTVNEPATLNPNLPVNQTICTDKVATFTVAVATGTGPFTYQWQVSTNSGNPPWTNITNGGVYSGATTATLTITAPPVSMNGYFYRAVVNGAAPCGSAISRIAMLTVNPLPTIVIAANPYTSLFPGLRTTLTSTITPFAGVQFTWLRNGVAIPNANTGTLANIDVDGLGTYQLRVTDLNGCTNVSNIITIKDSATGRCFIYPNPTSGKFQVRYYSVANNILPRSLTVYDAKGDRVFTQMYTIGRPYDRMDVDMRAYGKGLYWVEIGDLNGSRITMCRVVIQ